MNLFLWNKGEGILFNKAKDKEAVSNTAIWSSISHNGSAITFERSSIDSIVLHSVYLPIDKIIP